MAINFEAANMAGYNNPKIEVFAVTLNEEAAIATAPSKSELLNCTQRGSIPFLLMKDSAALAAWLLPLGEIVLQSSGKYQLSFGSVYYDASGDYTAISVFYPETDDTLPALKLQVLPKQI